MLAFEIETSIIDHRIEINNACLPKMPTRAKVIVLYENTDPTNQSTISNIGPLAEFRANPMHIYNFEPLSRDMANAR